MIILDTCALIWLTNKPDLLSPKAANMIRRKADALAVVPISAWEVALKINNGTLQLHGTLSPLKWYHEVVSRYGICEIPLDAALLCASAGLPLIHRDPCDRMIVAAAITNHAAIITADANIPKYPGVKVVW